MPLYEYRCQKCGHTFNVRHAPGAPAPKRCQVGKCRGKLVRVISMPAAIIFRGSGFHCNDYK